MYGFAWVQLRIRAENGMTANDSHGPRLIRRAAGYEVLGLPTGESVIRAVEPSDTTRIVRLERAVGAHRAAPGPGLAPVLNTVTSGEARLACNIRWDGETVVQRIVRAERKLPFDAAAGFVERLGEALACAHAVLDPTTGQPFCFGVLGWPLFLFDDTGNFHLFGLGASVLVERAPLTPGAFAAGDVLAGAAPGPGSDVVAAVLLQRSMLGLVDLPDPLARAFQFRPQAGDALLAWDLAQANARLFVGPPHLRPSADESLQILRRTWNRLAVTPDQRALADWVRDLAREPVDTLRLRLAPDAARFAIEGQPVVHLGRRQTLRLILLQLVAARLNGIESVTADDLVTVGWPNERIQPVAAVKRLYVAISTLRAMGLGDLLERFDKGYRLAPGVEPIITPGLGSDA